MKARVDISFKCFHCRAQNSVKVDLFDLIQMWEQEMKITFYCIQCGRENHLKNEVV